MVVPDSGTITINGQNVIKDWKYRSQIGYMPQIGRYPDNMTIRQVIDMVKDIRASTTKNRDIATDESLIEDFHLDGVGQVEAPLGLDGIREHRTDVAVLVHERELTVGLVVLEVFGAHGATRTRPPAKPGISGRAFP